MARNTGLCGGLLIFMLIGAVLLQDRANRLRAAQQQSLALATSVDRMVLYELRNVERALRGISAEIDAASRDAAGQRHIDASIAGVVSRHRELETIAWRHAEDGARLAGRDAAATTDQRGQTGLPGTGLSIGGLRQGADGWHLSLTMSVPAGGWLVTDMRVDELQGMLDAYELGRDGTMLLFDRAGIVVARHGNARESIGRAVELPATEAWRAGVATLEARSALDGVERLMAFSANSGYALVAGAGMGRREVLAPWWRRAALAGLVMLVYGLALAYLVRRLRANEAARERMLGELELQAEWLQQAQRATRTGVWRIDPGETSVRASVELAELFGIDPGDGTIPIDALIQHVHPDDRERIRREFAQFTQATETQATFAQSYRVMRSDGTVRWVEGRGAMLRDRRSHIVMTGTVNDVSDLRATQLRVEGAEVQFRHLFERNPLPCWVVDDETRHFLAVNDAVIDGYGYGRDALLTMRDTDLLAPGTATRQIPAEGIVLHAARDGREILAHVQAREITFSDRAAQLVLAEDVGERVAYERDLAWRATHDPTTGLLTLPAMIEQLEAHCATAGGAGFAIVYVRLRDLELVAPTLGRSAAETLLREAAARIGRVGARYGCVAYAPADSFVLAVFDLRERDEMVAALAEVIDAPFALEGGGLQSLEAWVGLAEGACKGAGAEQVVGHAMLAALKARRDNLSSLVYDATMATVAADRLALLQRVRRAFELREFEVFFQPIRRVSDGRILTLEALLRWRQADGTFVPPMQFIPLCEESGLIVPIGAWVMEQAALAHRRLTAAGHVDVAIAVNVSAVQFDGDTTFDTLQRLQRAYGLPAHALHLELTESALLQNPEAARAQMKRLREQGACLSIDDFGTGFSSMAYLRDLPLDHLKIDRTFVQDVDSDARNASICQALIALGQGLGLQIIAEGVERPEQLEWLRTHGCDQAQGYHLGRPVTLDDALVALHR